MTIVGEEGPGVVSSVITEILYCVQSLPESGTAYNYTGGGSLCVGSAGNTSGGVSGSV